METKDIKEICRLQHKDFVYRILINRMPIAYTNHDVYNLKRDTKIRSDYEENKTVLYKKVEEVGREAIEATFGNKEIMQNEENRFTLDDQRKASAEVLGKELTLEEVLERYEVN